MAEGTERIPQHRHCGNCGRAHVSEGRFCGSECMESKKTELKRKKRQLLFLWLVCAAVGIGAILLSL